MEFITDKDTHGVTVAGVTICSDTDICNDVDSLDADNVKSIQNMNMNNNGIETTETNSNSTTTISSNSISDINNNSNIQFNSVKVSQSWIPCSGLGLFANKKILYGEIICTYFGTKYCTVEALKLHDKSYLMRLGIQCYIDSNQHLDCLARYINDCRNKLCYNDRFNKNCSDGIAQVIAIRDIEENEELYVDYGKWYWLSLNPSKLKFMEVQNNKSKIPLEGDEVG